MIIKISNNAKNIKFGSFEYQTMLESNINCLNKNVFKIIYSLFKLLVSLILLIIFQK